MPIKLFWILVLFFYFIPNVGMKENATLTPDQKLLLELYTQHPSYLTLPLTYSINPETLISSPPSLKTIVFHAFNLFPATLTNNISKIPQSILEEFGQFLESNLKTMIIKDLKLSSENKIITVSKIPRPEPFHVSQLRSLFLYTILYDKNTPKTDFVYHFSLGGYKPQEIEFNSFIGKAQLEIQYALGDSFNDKDRLRIILEYNNSYPKRYSLSTLIESNFGRLLLKNAYLELSQQYTCLPSIEHLTNNELDLLHKSIETEHYTMYPTQKLECLQKQVNAFNFFKKKAGEKCTSLIEHSIINYLQAKANKYWLQVTCHKNKKYYTLKPTYIIENHPAYLQKLIAKKNVFTINPPNPPYNNSSRIAAKIYGILGIFAVQDIDRQYNNPYHHIQLMQKIVIHKNLLPMSIDSTNSQGTDTSIDTCIKKVRMRDQAVTIQLLSQLAYGGNTIFTGRIGGTQGIFTFPNNKKGPVTQLFEYIAYPELEIWIQSMRNDKKPFSDTIFKLFKNPLTLCIENNSFFN